MLGHHCVCQKVDGFPSKLFTAPYFPQTVSWLSTDNKLQPLCGIGVVVEAA
jgi:hypothetical protein